MQLIHGDCLDKMKDISDKSVDMIVTDPPYGIGYKSNKQTGDTRKGRGIKVRNESYFDKILGDETLPVEWLSKAYSILNDNGAIYIFCHWSMWSKLEKAVKDYNFNVKNMIVINKSNHGMGDVRGGYAPKHELILFATKGRHIFQNSEYGRGKDVFDGKVLFSGSYPHHPNEKPVSWIEPIIHRSCPKGGCVIDPFMGSGSTGIACINAGREFIGIEKDDKYFKIAKKRIEEYSTTKHSKKKTKYFFS